MSAVPLHCELYQELRKLDKLRRESDNLVKNINSLLAQVNESGGTSAVSSRTIDKLRVAYADLSENYAAEAMYVSLYSLTLVLIPSPNSFTLTLSISQSHLHPLSHHSHPLSLILNSLSPPPPSLSSTLIHSRPPSSTLSHSQLPLTSSPITLIHSLSFSTPSHHVPHHPHPLSQLTPPTSDYPRHVSAVSSFSSTRTTRG